MIELFSHQLEHAKQFREKPLNMSQTGSGKTFTALQAFKESGCKQLLIMCLPSKVQDWADDAKELGINVAPLSGTPKKRLESLQANTAVSISFSTVWRDEKHIIPWAKNDTFLIIDEAQKVKNRTSKVGKFTLKLCKIVKHSYLLSATFIANGRLEEWYMPLYISNVWRKPYKEFKQMFLIEQLVSMGAMKFNQIVGYQNEHLLDQMIKEASVSHKRDKAYTPQFKVIKTKRPAMFNKLKKERIYPMDNGEIRELDTTGALFNSLRQVSTGVLSGVDKIISKDVFERLEDTLEAHNEPVIIFYNYNAQRDQLIKLVNKLGRPLSEYNGNIKDTKAFEETDNAVILCHPKSAGTGVNFLVKSTVTIFLGMPLSSVDYIQCLGRTDRANTQGTPLYYLIIPDTPVENKIYDTVISGQDVTNELIEKLVK